MYNIVSIYSGFPYVQLSLWRQKKKKRGGNIVKNQTTSSL